MIIDKVKALLRPDVDPSVKLTGVGVFIGKTFDWLETRIVDLEKRQLEKGDKGDIGDAGPIGPTGKDGKDGKDGRSITGPKGDKGDTGPVGKTGKQGVSVVDAEVAADGNLVLKLSNGNIIDAGELPKEKGNNGGVFVSGNAWQITVSSTAPTNPQLNQLWYDSS
jgi:hypothetical protein